MAHETRMAHDHEHEHHLTNIPSDPALRVKALESLLIEKGLVDPSAIEAWLDIYEHKVGPHIGAKVVARAWVDSEFKRRLLADATGPIGEMDLPGHSAHQFVVVENTPDAHNLVVCTLCSCYPWALLGLPPRWYKASPYRSRAVIDPRGVLREFGVELPESIAVHVWDSTSEVRYLVLPERPRGTEALSEAELAALVTRDSMIGVARDFARPARSAA
jgi:nitrile hydratase subunit alpha